MRVIRGSRLILILVIAALVMTSVPTEAFACWYCKKSPNGWGFCRSGYMAGWGDCYEYVADAWSGRTDCNYWGECGRGVVECGPENNYCVEEQDWAASTPCHWTDRDPSELV